MKWAGLKKKSVGNPMWGSCSGGQRRIASPKNETLTEHECDIQRKHRTSELPGILIELKKMSKKLPTSLLSVADDGLIPRQSLRPVCAACADQSAVDGYTRCSMGCFLLLNRAVTSRRICHDFAAISKNHMPPETPDAVWGFRHFRGDFRVALQRD
jgi:hypothetical protein